MTSMCSQSAPFWSTESHSAARQAKSADRMEGLMAVAGRSRPGRDAGRSRRGAMPARSQPPAALMDGLQMAQPCTLATVGLPCPAD